MAKKDAWEFSIPKHVKNSIPGPPARTFNLPSFPQDNAICVVRVLLILSLLVTFGRLVNFGRMREDAIILLDVSSNIIVSLA